MKYIYICKTLIGDYRTDEKCPYLGINKLCAIKIMNFFKDTPKCTMKKYEIRKAK